MKNKLFKLMKTIVLSVVAVAVVAVGSFSSSVGAYASETTGSELDATDTTGVRFVKYSSNEYISSCFTAKEAPEYTDNAEANFGYLFGGWYSKTADNNYDPIETEEDFNAAETIVAKFVPAQTLSVKCQNWAGTVKGSEDVKVRVISAVDSKNYSQYGFVVSKIDGERNETWLTDKDDPYTTTNVYSTFNYYNGSNAEPVASYKPSELFGAAAYRFTTCVITGVPADAHGTIICIKPFWDTLDGTRVYGLSKFAHVEDGYLNYVNVPVNLNILNAKNGAAAGMLTVTPDDGLTLVDVEYGKVFEEMAHNELSDGTIKCVGNVSDISSNKTEMDIYINLRFEKSSTSTESESTEPVVGNCYTFYVTGEEFCDNGEEKLKDMDVWNIKY